MKIDFIFILPCSFYGESLTPGHKKDFFKLAEKLRNNNKIVEILYSDNKKIYGPSLEEASITLKDIFRNKFYQNSVIVIGPVHKFRLTLFMRKKRDIYYYIFDSILKTSIFAFLNNYKLVHRVFYAFLVEFILRKHKIIVSSLEEYSWFSSTGHKIKNIYLMTPLPDISTSIEKGLVQDSIKKIIFYNPTGDGILIAKSLINELISNNVAAQIIVTGIEASLIENEMPKYSYLHFIPYAENISNIISKCTIAVLTDVSGSGFCNRAVQIRGLGVPLLCTLPSLRGTGLLVDSGVEILYSTAQGINYIKENIDNLNHSKSAAFNSIIIRGYKDMDYFERSCFDGN